jgi:hypothetical protein
MFLSCVSIYNIQGKRKSVAQMNVAYISRLSRKCYIIKKKEIKVIFMTGFNSAGNNPSLMFRTMKVFLIRQITFQKFLLKAKVKRLSKL